MVVCCLRGLLEVYLVEWNVTGKAGVRVPRGEGEVAFCKLQVLFHHERGKLILCVRFYGG